MIEAYLLINRSRKAWVQAALARTGVDARCFNGHSFRNGAATTASMQGLEDSLIQKPARWRSDAYKAYIEIPRTELANVSRRLVS